MAKPLLILDLDGVLITTPMWKADEMDSDGYSKFNQSCIDNLNTLLSLDDFDIWLSSTRRTVKSIEEFNTIFINRNITKPIKGFLPVYENCNNRKEEILKFLEEFKPQNYLIIDDDKSLNDLDEITKEKLVLTELMKGFNQEQLKLATEKMKKNLDKNDFLDKYIFFGLKNLNDGFDTESIKYFSETDFSIVLKRVEENNIGISGIEPWLNGEFYNVLTSEDYSANPIDPKWYWKAFEELKKKEKHLQYSASYLYL